MKQQKLKLRPIYEVEATNQGNFSCLRFTAAFFERIQTEDAVVLLAYQGRWGLIPPETFANTWWTYLGWLRGRIRGRDSIPESIGIIGWNQTIPFDPRTLRALRLESKKESNQDTTSGHTGAEC